MGKLSIVIHCFIKSFILLIMIPGLILTLARLAYLAYQKNLDKHPTITFRMLGDDALYFATKMDKYYKVSWFENGKEVEVLYPIADAERYLREGKWIIQEVE